MNSIMSRIHGKCTGLRRVLYIVFLGQLVSFMLALMNFNSSLSANLGVNAPFTLAFFSYLALTLVYGSILLYRRQKLQISWYWYVILGFVDVQGSFLVNKAYQFSSITSLTILGCMTVVWVIILTWLFLGTNYSLWQYLGSAVCVTGLCLVVFSDSGVGGGAIMLNQFTGSTGSSGGSNPVLGDVLVIGGTIFFALSNVGEEFCVKKAGRVEVIAMFGLFSTLVSLVEIAIFDKKNLEVVTWSPEVILNFVGFGISGFMFGSITPLVLQASGATLLNLSLLTTDLWAVVFRVFFYHQKVDWLYYVSFLFVGIGLVIYSNKTEKNFPEIQKVENGDPDPNQMYQPLPEKASQV